MRIGILGGSFNPIHNGHLNIAKSFLERLSLDKIIFIPTYMSPHKTLSSGASTEERLNMCHLAVKDEPKFEVSDIEIKRQGKSYTIDTLKQLKKMYQSDKLFLIVGADMFLCLDTWKDYKNILLLANICAAPRDDDNAAVLKKFSEKVKNDGGKTFIEDIPLINISSTDIRNRIANNITILNMVPYSVAEYISENNLYREV